MKIIPIETAPKGQRIAHPWPASQIPVAWFSWSSRADLLIREVTVAFGRTTTSLSLMGFAELVRPENLTHRMGCGPVTLNEIRDTIRHHLGNKTPEAWRLPGHP
jgi:hypothetical protein